MGSAGIAAADSGKFYKNADGSIVFYPYTSGDVRGYDFRVSNGQQQLCADAPGDALQEFVTNYRRNRTLQPDVTEKTVSASYYEARKCSSSFTASASNTYHLDIIWSAAAGATSAINGVTEHVP